MARARLDVVPFADEHLDAAARLLAERHARHRASEPLLPDVADFRAQLERDWRHDGASGAIAYRGGEAVAYVVGRPREDKVDTRALWIDLAGFAATEPEATRDVYAAAADAWVDGGLTRHFVFVPALDDLVRPWFRLCFGASAATAVRETAPEPAVDAELTIRPSTPDDLDASARLDRAMHESMQPGPSFSAWPIPTLEEYIDEWRTLWDEEEYAHFVAERDGRLVGHIVLYRRPPGDLRIREDSIDLSAASTAPAERGSGIGLALTAHVLAWAHENGYPVMTTDWRMTNLLASRFWPARGWRETFVRLYRSIP